MRRLLFLPFLLGAGLLGPGSAAVAQEAGQPEPAPGEEAAPVFGAGTSTVVLDVIIRDKKGRPIPDIDQSEVEVYENGVKQEIESFRRIETGSAALAAPSMPETTERPDVSRQLNIVTIVFDHIGPDNRRLARKAAEEFLERGLGPNVWVSVFGIGNRLSMIQGFTNDREKLDKALDRATTGTEFDPAEEQAALDAALAEADALRASAASAANESTPTPGSAPDGGAIGAAAAAQAQARALQNMIEMAKSLQRQQVGGTSLYPLLGLVKGHKTLAGRKTLLYISQGLWVPPQLDAVYRSIIGEANNANVSIYTMDARGLDTTRAMAAAAEDLDAARSLSQDIATNRGSGAVSKSDIKMAETAEQALKNVQGTLDELAESTGGFATTNTNNFSRGAERIAYDLSSYYELTYSPPPGPYDGSFRAIDVQVSRKSARVQSRSGYFALPPGASNALFAYEVPLLGALTLKKPPQDFTVRMGTFHFGDTPTGRDEKLIVEVPTGDLTMETDEVNQRYQVHLSLYAAVKDAADQIVERYSEDYPLEGPLEKADAIKAGNIVFKRRVALIPGKYTLEFAAQDRKTRKMTVAREPFEVRTGSGPRTSSIVVIRNLQPAPEGAKDENDPLDYHTAQGSLRFIPNLDAPISAAANDKLWLYCIIYPDSSGARPTMRLAFSKDGQAIGAPQPVTLPEADADGAFHWVVNFPLTKFPPTGDYQVKVTLDEGDRQWVETTAFRIVP